jgi:4-diphosphocytidyl-2-C-methyl-D-erythritol kinase
MADRREVSVNAPAKINVVLRLLGRREDGYHDLESLVLPVSLADVVTAREDDRVSVGMFHPDGRPMLLPDPDTNLAFLATEAWLDASSNRDRTPSIVVEKNIPMAAGLGGGSADAAGVLRALNALWDDELSDEDLSRIGAEIGSDVPAMLRSGATVMRGRGEMVEPVEAARTWWVLVPQPFAVRTPEAYSWWDEESSTANVSIDDALDAVRTGDPKELARWLWNDLQSPVARRHAQIQVAVERLLDAGALGAVMSGSGPTVAGLAADEPDADRIADRVPGGIPVSAPPPEVPLLRKPPPARTRSAPEEASDNSEQQPD